MTSLFLYFEDSRSKCNHLSCKFFPKSFTFSENCPHTFSNAFGYWAAYGMSKRTIIIK